jgi:hypothetical protein
MAFPAPTPQQNQVGAFVPTSFIWDVQQLYQVEVNSPEFKELLVRLYQNVANIANVLNIKDSGYYNTLEFVNGQLFFSSPFFDSQTAQTAVFRQVLRKVINFGALPNTGTKSVAHGITCIPFNAGPPVTPGTTFTRIYGCASDTTGLTYIPIPYASVTSSADNVELYVDATNVNITTGSNLSNYVVTYVILEYLQT